MWLRVIVPGPGQPALVGRSCLLGETPKSAKRPDGHGAVFNILGELPNLPTDSAGDGSWRNKLLPRAKGLFTVSD